MSKDSDSTLTSNKHLASGEELRHPILDLPKEFYKDLNIVKTTGDAPRKIGDGVYITVEGPRDLFEGVEVKTAVLDKVRTYVDGFQNSGIEKIVGPTPLRGPKETVYRTKYRVVRYY